MKRSDQRALYLATERDPEKTAEIEEIRKAARLESISYGEVARLNELVAHIDPEDGELLPWAGVEEFDQ